MPLAGLVCTSSSLSSTNAPTLSTYTLPGGASYFYEAPSGYQLATDAPLVARPLSPDTQLVSRQLSSEGPLIARPFTPSNNTFVSQTSNNPGGIRSTAFPSHGKYKMDGKTFKFNKFYLLSMIFRFIGAFFRRFNCSPSAYEIQFGYDSRSGRCICTVQFPQ